MLGLPKKYVIAYNNKTNLLSSSEQNQCDNVNIMIGGRNPSNISNTQFRSSNFELRNYLDDTSFSDKFFKFSKKKLSDQMIVSTLHNAKELGVEFPKLSDKWSIFQKFNVDTAQILYNIRFLFVEWLKDKIHGHIKKVKPDFVINAILENFGSRYTTSDIDINILPVLDLAKIDNRYDEYTKFLRRIIDIYVKTILTGEKFWYNYCIDDLEDFLSKNDKHFIITSEMLDINVYPPGPLLKIDVSYDDHLNFMKGISVNDNNVACFIPIILNDEMADQFIQNEVSKSIKIVEENGEILSSCKTNIIDYYLAYKGTIDRGEDCYKNKSGGVSNCLRLLIENLLKVDNKKNEIEYARRWNDILCCTIGTNKYGNELYFTSSSIIFVVFYMQICNECNNIKIRLSDLVLKTVAVPTCIEQLCFYVLHKRKDKYMYRAKMAYLHAKPKHRRYIHDICKTNRELNSAFGLMTL